MREIYYTIQKYVWIVVFQRGSGAFTKYQLVDRIQNAVVVVVNFDGSATQNKRTIKKTEKRTMDYSASVLDFHAEDDELRLGYTNCRSIHN